MLTGLPIKLHDGSIAAVTARIPWPNPLTSSLGFSIQSLRLAFHLVPVVSEPILFSTANLADSVASVAETFIHDELTPREEATLRESFHPDLAYDHSRNVPGSMDPFLRATDDEEFHSDVDPAGVSMFATLIERLLARFEFEAVDTKITIIHPKHACFTFSIAEARYGTEDSQGADSSAGVAEEIERTFGETRRVSISGLSLTARDLRPPTLPSPTSLTPSTASPVSPKVSSPFAAGSWSSHRSPSSSPASSSSSLDEDTQLLMSQSLAFLPPRPQPSPSSSMTSSMYQSAISTIDEVQYVVDHSSRRNRTPSPGDHSRPADISTSHSPSRPDYEDPVSEPDLEPEDEMIVSCGAESIVIRLTTPPVSVSTPDLADDLSSQHHRASPTWYDRPPREKDEPGGRQIMQLTCSAGVLACAFRPWHIRAILDVLDAWGTHHTPSVSPPGKPPTTSGSADTIFSLGLDASMKLRGVVIILLPSKILGEPRDTTSLERFFAHPLVPPRLVHGCTRIFLDSLLASCSLSKPLSAASQPQTRAAGVPVVSATYVVTTTLALGDLSAFALLAVSKSPYHDMELSASPIAITDRNLPTQYSTTHVHPGSHTKFSEQNDYPRLHKFAIVDWTDEAHQTNSTKPSTWRTKVKPKAPKRRDSQTRAGVGVPSSPNTPSPNTGLTGMQSTNAPAITVTARFAFASSEKGQNGPELDDHVEVDVVPLHIFVDLGLALGSNHVLTFLDGVIGSQAEAAKGSHNDDEDSDRDDPVVANTLPATPRERSRKERETERQRLERLVLEDLDLDLDYRDNVPANNFRPGGILSASRGQRPQVGLDSYYCYKLIICLQPQKSKPQRRPKITMNLRMIRLQVRCPPPPSRVPRSGAIILDMHGIRLSNETVLEAKPAIRFVDSPSSPPESHTQEFSDRDTLLTAQCQRLVIAGSLLDSEIASIVLSLGSLSSVDEAVPDSSRFGTGISSPVKMSTVDPLPLRIHVSQTKPASKPSLRLRTSNAVVVTIDLPSLHADLSKSLLDGVQLWADDVSQLMERTFGGVGEDADTERAESRDPSLIGSRFFVKPRRHGSKSSDEGSTSFNGAHVEAPKETVIKIALSEGSGI
jgi:autophagy-related protein 2